jgi:hypothetical protein
MSSGNNNNNNAIQYTIVNGQELIEIFENIVINCRNQRETKVIDLIKKYAYYKTNNSSTTIFTLEYETDDNDLLAICCINKLPNAADLLITDYADLFDVGTANPLGQTALILAIINDLFSVASDLLNNFLEDCNPGQVTHGDGFQLSALDFMLQKNKDIIKENIEIVANLLDYYIENEDTSPVFHRNIDIICRDIKFYEPLLKPYFSKDRLDLNERFCKDIVPAEIGPFRDFHTNLPNTRGMNEIRINAEPVNLQMVIPTNDRNFPHEYTREEEDSFRINKRQRNEDPDENRGGAKNRKLKKSKKPKSTKKSKTIKNTKKSKNKKAKLKKQTKTKKLNKTKRNR